MNTKHTPGKWKRSVKKWDYHEIQIIIDEDENVICQAETDFMAYPEGSAIETFYEDEDFNLIAAAPELLEALQTLLNLDPKAVDISARIHAEAAAKAAIQKATGNQ